MSDHIIKGVQQSSGQTVIDLDTNRPPSRDIEERRGENQLCAGSLGGRL